MARASIRSAFSENAPWNGAWNLAVGDIYEATVIRRVDGSVHCGNETGYLVMLRAGALFLLCCDKEMELEIGSMHKGRISLNERGRICLELLAH